MHNEMKEAIRKHFEGLFEIDDDFDFDTEAAIYYFAAHWHDGQWSELYSVLSHSDYRPGACETFDSWREDNFGAGMMYDFLVLTFAPALSTATA